MSVVLAAETALTVLKQYWGYDRFLPFQEDAVNAILDRRDSLVILPTGGGKSLCFQLPALLVEGTAIVVSPLISLMKDQVDTLTNMGIQAAYLNSTLSESERDDTLFRLRNGSLQLLYVAPERLTMPDFLQLLDTVSISFFVIDEAHCISQWGHDFRPAYRVLRNLRERFQDTRIHAFTATATPPVCKDILEALHLSDARLLIGDFDRPNLTYRVLPRSDMLTQVCEIVQRHPGEGGVIYCISRKDVDDLAGLLKQEGYNVLPYHAGLDDQTRHRHQEAFMKETVDIVVATVAFGMGIDRPNIRYVIHTGMPKSVEHYQQEAGRAGRDRLPAECVLLYSRGDVSKWRMIMERSQEAGDAAYFQETVNKLEEMGRYCQSMVCRHRFLVEYFGQAFHSKSCQQCDTCLGEFEIQDDSLTIAQKILSCVLRVKERFGASHIALVLKGSNREKVREFRHDQLSTFGLLKDYKRQDLLQWMEQLLQQGFLKKDPQYYSLALTLAGAKLLKGEGSVTLSKALTREKTASTPAGGVNNYDQADEALFQDLRRLRRILADDRGVPPFVIFGDATLHEMVALKPRTLEAFRRIRGVGEAKLRDVCPEFLPMILTHTGAGDKVAISSSSTLERKTASTPSKSLTRAQAFQLFGEGATLEAVIEQTGRAPSTVAGYLCEFLQENPATSTSWLSEETYQRVRDVAMYHDDGRLKPLFDALNGEVSYEEIRIAIAMMGHRLGEAASL